MIPTLNSLLCDENFINLDARLAQYNLFRALGIDHYEVRHTTFLSHLLDPSEPHGLGTEFLNNLLLWLSKSSGSDIPVRDLDLDMTLVKPEWTASGGDIQKEEKSKDRLDILIDIPKKGGVGKYIIAIECKIRASLGKDQLHRYNEMLRGIGSPIDLKILLTIEEFDDDLGKDSDDWVNVTYFDTVLKAVSTTLLKIGKTASPRILDILNDYSILISSLTSEESNSDELNALCENLIVYKEVLRTEADYLNIKHRKAANYLGAYIEESSDAQAVFLKTFRSRVEDMKFCSAYSNRVYQRFYPANVYPFGLSSSEIWWFRQNKKEAKAYPLLFEIILDSAQNNGEIRARCVLTLSPMDDSTIDQRQLVADRIRDLFVSDKFWKVRRGKATGTFTRIMSSRWKPIPSTEAIHHYLEDLFEKAKLAARLIEDDDGLKTGVLYVGGRP